MMKKMRMEEGTNQALQMKVKRKKPRLKLRMERA